MGVCLLCVLSVLSIIKFCKINYMKLAHLTCNDVQDTVSERLGH